MRTGTDTFSTDCGRRRRSSVSSDTSATSAAASSRAPTPSNNVLLVSELILAAMPGSAGIGSPAWERRA